MEKQGSYEREIIPAVAERATFPTQPGRSACRSIRPTRSIRLGPLAVRFLVTGEDLERQRRGVRGPRSGRATPGGSGP